MISLPGTSVGITMFCRAVMETDVGHGSARRATKNDGVRVDSLARVRARTIESYWQQIAEL